MKNLFRGKSKESGKWIYGSLVHSLQNLEPAIYEHKKDGTSFNGENVFAETIGQSLDAYDWKGSRIFSNSVVVVTANGIGRSYEIEYSTQCCGYIMRNELGIRTFNSLGAEHNSDGMFFTNLELVRD